MNTMDDTRKSKSQLIEEIKKLRRVNGELRIQVTAAVAGLTGDNLPSYVHSALVGWGRTRLSDGRMIECNKQLALILGYDTVEEVIEEFFSTNHYVDAKARENLISLIMEKGEVHNFQAEITRRDGARIWVEFYARLYPEEGLIEIVVMDISERKLVELELKESEEKFRSPVTNIPGVV